MIDKSIEKQHQLPMQRPVSATVFGILNIAFGVMGLVGLLVSLALFSVAATGASPVAKIMRENPSYALWIKVSIPLWLLATAALLAAAVGLLKCKEWGRKLSIGYAIYSVLLGVLGLLLNFFFLVQPLLREAAQRQGPEAAGAIGGAVGGSVGGCFGLIYPILLLIFMTRPKLVAAFQARPESTMLPPG
jgi:hypothetical protein